ncbi:hypothetical protein QQF64_032896 [Cirrhinus molitorella]|uniref:Uncharacterized protein n=1 Tax=Cirrhinus molitorella TaxID=172907 RepID=A0ABR3MSC6_9TELE
MQVAATAEKELGFAGVRKQEKMRNKRHVSSKGASEVGLESDRRERERRGRQKMEAKCFRGRQLEVSVSHHGCLTSAFALNIKKRNHAGKH